MRYVPFAAALCLATIPAIAAPLAEDVPATFGNAQVVCTGVGSAQDDPTWNAFPIRMVFSNAGGQFVSGVTVSLSRSNGSHVATFSCDTPWALMQLPAGSYRASVKLDETGTVRSANFTSRGNVSPAAYSGIAAQQRVEIQFPLPPNN